LFNKRMELWTESHCKQSGILKLGILKARFTVENKPERMPESNWVRVYRFDTQLLVEHQDARQTSYSVV
jgi:hypothetical protein